jgi:hypothetical protein
MKLMQAKAEVSVNYKTKYDDLLVKFVESQSENEGLEKENKKLMVKLLWEKEKVSVLSP